MRNKVRIIAGHHRHRLIDFPSIENLRPTADRVRETLFNWLMPYIQDANCLDCFAGSGILGFEALSRGASNVTFIDGARVAIESIELNAEKLKLTNYHAVMANQPSALSQCKHAFDIIFLDPPYHSGLMNTMLNEIQQRKLLKEGGLIYLEEAADDAIEIPAPFVLHKGDKTKHISYRLIKAG